MVAVIHPDRLDRRGDAVRVARPGRARRRSCSSAAIAPAGSNRDHARARLGVTPLLVAIALAARLARRGARVLGRRPARLRAARAAARSGRPGPPACEPPAPAPDGWLRPGWLARAAARLGGRLPPGHPARRLRRLLHPVGAASRTTSSSAGWPAGHTGQTLLDLTGADVRLPQRPDRAARRRRRRGGRGRSTSSPSGSTRTVRRRHDGRHLRRRQPRHLVAGRPGDGLRGDHGVPRRSLALALIAIGFAAQWVPWARIDRAAFQYHYYTALPFVILALAYFVAELWHGAVAPDVAAGAARGRRSRSSAPALMWLFVAAAVRVRRRRVGQPGLAGLSGRHPRLVLTVADARAARRRRRSAAVVAASAAVPRARARPTARCASADRPAARSARSS